MDPFDRPPSRGRPSFDPVDWLARNPGKAFPVVWGAALVILVVWGLLTSFYTVDADEQAVILRFGKYHDITGPGFHTRLPFGIDEVLKGKVLTVLREEFGYRTIRSGVQSQFDYDRPEAVAEATMLTGDLNLVMVNWEVRYRIRDLKEWSFNVRDPVSTLRDVSQAVMRTEVGDRSVDEVLTLDRIEIMTEVTTKMQTILDELGCGITVVQVNLKRADPPEAVRDAFNAVNQAIQVRDRIINDAEGERNRKIPAARGAKEKAIREAEGYLIARVNRAEGDTTAFLSVLEEYRKAEDVTRRRLYLEAMAKLLPALQEITIVDEDAGGVLKLLDLTGGKKEENR